MSNPQETYFKHVNSLSDLLQGLVDKSMAEHLGPADGDLYMQLCKFFEAHTALLEEQTRESIEKRRSNPSGDQEEDAEPEGGGPSDSES